MPRLCQYQLPGWMHFLVPEVVDHLYFTLAGGWGVHRKRLCCLSISCRIREIGFKVFSADPSFSLRMLQLLRWADIIIPVNSMLFPQIALTGGVRTGVSQLCFWLVPSLLHLL